MATIDCPQLRCSLEKGGRIEILRSFRGTRFPRFAAGSASLPIVHFASIFGGPYSGVIWRQVPAGARKLPLKAVAKSERPLP